MSKHHSFAFKGFVFSKYTSFNYFKVIWVLFQFVIDLLYFQLRISSFFFSSREKDWPYRVTLVKIITSINLRPLAVTALIIKTQVVLLGPVITA